mgnify:CR=1
IHRSSRDFSRHRRRNILNRDHRSYFTSFFKNHNSRTPPKNRPKIFQIPKLRFAQFYDQNRRFRLKIEIVK